MQKVLLFVDKISTWVGQAFSWLIVALTLHISWEVFSRYVLDHPRAWAFDAMIMMYGTLFMMAGAYTLAKNGHVRGDVIYGYFTPRAQAILDLTLYIVFFIPGIVALTYAGYFYAAESWAINEHSNITSEGPPVYPFKTVIPLAGAFVLVQGIVEIIRCIICLNTGDWPPRAEDVVEVDVDKLKAELDVKDEDIQNLDQYVVMSNDVLIAIPLFLFMGYLVERAQLIDKLFRSLHLATARVPGSLAVATIVTCAIFATATGIVGAVVTLMGLLAFPAMLKAGYNVKVAAGAVTAGGCLGILIPPSVLLIVYGAVAGVSVVQLYAGAFLPGFMLAGLYIGYVIVLAKWNPRLMPPLPQSERRVELPSFAQALAPLGSNALTGLWRALTAGGSIAKRTALGQLMVTLIPLLFIAALLGVTYRMATAPEVEASTAGLIEAGGLIAAPEPEREASTGLIGTPEAEEKDPEVKQPPAAEAKQAVPEKPAAAAATEHERQRVPLWLWIAFGAGIGAVAVIYRLWSWERLEVFKMLLSS